MTLVEVLIACVILMILASAVFGVLLSAFKTTNNDKLRVAASNLASREVEIVRQYFNSGSAAVNDVTDPAHATRTNYYPLPGHTQGQPLVVDGVPFTVVESVAVQVLGPGVSACDGGPGVAHPSYSLTTTVTWPKMGVTKPVVDETILTPPKGVVQDDLYGYLAVSVTNAANSPTAGIPVQISGPAGTFSPLTDASGCAVIALNRAGTYTASLNSTGYVDFYGALAPVLPNISVTIGQLTKKSMTYDRAGELDVTLTTAAGHSLPASMPSITVANSGLQPTGEEVLTSTAATTAHAGLWPFPSGYSLWAGSCADADPVASGGSRVGPAVVAAGAVQAVQVPLAPLDVTVLDDAGNPVVGTTVSASEQTASDPTAHCGTDATLTLGVTDANGKLATSLPNGSWQVAAGTTATGTFSVTGQPVTAEVDLP